MNGGGGNGGGSGGSGSCDPTQVMSDVHNCGSCGHDCDAFTAIDPSRTSCVSGFCRVSCLPGFADCSAAPGCDTNITTADNCGACNNRCPTGLCASDGAGSFRCVSTCPATAPTVCSGSCVDTTSDPLDCGSCGRACAPGPSGIPSCNGGVCAVENGPDMRQTIVPTDLSQPLDMTLGGSTCAHSPCASGAALAPGCDPCVDKVCKTFSNCCLTVWTALCVSEAHQLCGSVCP
jgi:hypothetical protein